MSPNTRKPITRKRRASTRVQPEAVEKATKVVKTTKQPKAPPVALQHDDAATAPGSVDSAMVNKSIAEETEELPAAADAAEMVTSVAATSNNDEPNCDEESQKFKFRQRVYAKDLETGMFYESIVRRAMHGVQYQRHLKLNVIVSEDELSAFMEEEQEPTWWYYIHYLGWNVKWDRWVEEGHLYEPTESTKLFAKRLQEEVKNIRAELRSKSSAKPAAARVAMELERRMIQMEREHRMEERRRELSAQGKDMGQAEEEALLLQSTRGPRSKWTKANNILREMGLRERHLQGKRSQSSAELLVLPFSLKKIMVEEWEIVTQCDMLANLPAAVSIREALNMYLKSKLDAAMGPAEEKKEEAPVKSNDAAYETMSKQEKEWREMVDGICLFFDQALPERLLYQPEQIQYETTMEEGEEADTKRSSDTYGCEFLLRLFLRLPALLVGELSDKEAKSILAKLNDLARFLHKHQTTLFAQSYRRLNETELSRKEELEEM